MLNTQEGQKLKKSYRYLKFIPVFFLFWFLGISYFISQTLQREANKDNSARFQQLIEKQELDILYKLESYRNTIDALTDLYKPIAASDKVNHALWDDITARLHPKKHSPPIHAIGLVDRVKKSNIESYTEKIDAHFADLEFSLHQDPAFKPQMQQAEYFVIRFAAPYIDNIEGVGFDLYSLKASRDALEKSIKTKQKTITNTITLNQTHKQQNGFLLFNPIENEEGEVTSWVFIAFFADDFFEQKSFATPDQLYFKTFDENKQFYQNTTNLLWSAKNTLNLEKTSTLNALNDSLKWEIIWRISHTFQATGTDSFYYNFAIGAALSIIACLILHVIFRHQEKHIYHILEQKERFELAMEGAQNGIWDWDITTDEIYYSPRFRQLLDYDGHDVSAFPNTLETFENHLHPEDRNKTLRAILDHVQYNIPFSIEYRLRTRLGSYRYFFAKGKAFQDETGRAVRMTGSTTDITSQKQTQQDLIKEKNYSDHIVNHNPALIVALSSLGITRQINPKVLNVTGYSLNEIIGQNWWDLCMPDSSEKKILEVMNRFSIDEPIIDYEIPLITKSDEKRIISWTSLNQYDEYNELEEIIIFGIDVTERHKFENELISAKEAAEHANRAKSDFLAGMSHEIRTPMNGVIGTATLLADTKLSKSQQKYLDIIISSGRTLIDIINEILDYSKIEAGSLTIYEKPFDLHKCLDEQYGLLKPLADEKNLKYHMEYDSDFPKYIKGDEMRIRQVLTNLIGNAIKFTLEEGTIIISAERKKRYNKEILLFSILDTGVGIKSNKLDKIFLAFEQIIESRKQAKSAGTGLGLAISKRLVEMMGGQITVESKYKVGSTFSFTIPFIEPTDKETQKLSATAASSDKSAKESFNAHILVVEDVMTNQFVITNLLKNMDCTVDVANNGKEAVEAVIKTAYDLVLMDCQMPVMNGFEATRTIREKGFLELPIVALTANALDGDKEKCLESGMDDFLSKPVNKDRVISILKKYTH